MDLGGDLADRGSGLADSRFTIQWSNAELQRIQYEDSVNLMRSFRGFNMRIQSSNAEVGPP